MIRYYLYKGLKKPLVFFGLKDKYIYYAGATLISSLILAAVLSSFFGILGTLICLLIGGGGVYLTYKIQDRKGLYNKTKCDNEICVFPNRMNIKKHNKNEGKKEKI